MFDVLVTGLSCLGVYIDSISSSSSSSELATARSALRMHVFLLRWLSSLAEKSSSEASGIEKAARPAKGKAKPRGRAAELWSWDSQRLKLLQTFRNILQANLQRLWSPSKPEENFVNLFLSVAFNALAIPACGKDKDTRACINNIILSCAGHLGQHVNAASHLMNALNHHEHATVAAAELLVVASQHSFSSFIAEVMNEIGRMPMADLARDAAVARNFSSFLCELAEMAPSVALSHMSVLNPHLQVSTRSLPSLSLTCMPSTASPMS